jgi:hypothetical protein
MAKPAGDAGDKPPAFPCRLPNESLVDWVARLREDMQARSIAGWLPRVEDYLRESPELAPDSDAVLDLLTMERLLRREADDDWPIGAYTERFPHLRAEIEAQFTFDNALDGDEVMAGLDLGDDVAADPTGTAGEVPPKLPDRYHFVRLLGKGGFGKVWLYRDKDLGARPVAIKTLQNPDGGELVSERFRREAAMAARVTHPSVCVIHDSDLRHQPPYLVLEYVNGHSSRDLLNDPAPMAIDKAVRIARDVADGCQACHAKGIVHRDLTADHARMTHIPACRNQPRMSPGVTSVSKNVTPRSTAVRSKEIISCLSLGGP